MWRLRNLFIVVYIIIGLVVAWDRGYATLAWLKTLASAVLAVLLWWLVLLGINVHVPCAGPGPSRRSCCGAGRPAGSPGRPSRGP